MEGHLGSSYAFVTLRDISSLPFHDKHSRKWPITRPGQAPSPSQAPEGRVDLEVSFQGTKSVTVSGNWTTTSDTGP